VIVDFGRGVVDGLRGAAYLARHPRLWVWILAPALIAAVILIVAVGWLLTALSGAIDAIGAYLPGSWGDNVLRVVAAVVLAIASLSIFVSLAAVIAAPFNEMLSEAVEESVTGTPSPPFRIGRFVVDLAIGIAHGVRRVAVYSITMLLVLVLGVAVPVAGPILATVLSAWATARFAAYDAHDAVFARRRLRYRDKIAYLRARRWRTLGLGAVVGAMLVIPGVNLIGLSIGASAATLRLIAESKVAGIASRPVHG